MFGSIFEDLKRYYQMGHMVTKLLYVMVGVSLLYILLRAIAPSSVHFLNSLFALPDSFGELIYRPWTLFTYMFFSTSFWNILFSGFILHMFGQITGDLMGDKRILPIFIYSGLLAGLIFIISSRFANGPDLLLDSTAPILSIAVVSALVAPDYNVRLLLLGNVKIKFIVLFLIVITLLGIGNASAATTYISRTGGILFALIFIMSLRNGFDWSELFNWTRNSRPKRRNVKIVHKSKSSQSAKNPNTSNQQQERIDQILDKINKTGYDSLNEEEKEFLFLASKK